MKRSPMPPRRTPLVGNIETHWAWQARSRKAAIERAQERPSAAPIAREPKRRKPAKATGEARARRLVTARSGGLCEIRINGLCAYWAAEWSHRVARSQGGKWLASGGLAACRFCHSAITNTNGHRGEYLANGWVLNRNQDPASTPVLIHGRWVLLDDEGGWQQYEGAAA